MLTRRQTLSGAAAGLTLPVLAACGGSDDTTVTDPGAGSAGSTGGASVPTSDVPVGGGVILADHEVVITQPTDGEFKGYSAICTHQGCAVSKVEDGAIVCPCHMSRFSVADGSVQDGPAPEPLPEVELTVEGDTVTVA